MNPKRNTTVTRGPWNYGGMSGPDGHFIQPFRIRRENGERNAPIQHGQLYGHRLTGTYDERYAEANRLGLLYGYTQYYGRNTCGFVMSRAARKRGYKTGDTMYLRRQRDKQAEHAHNRLMSP